MERERSCLQLETGPGERVIACPWRTVACERPAPAVLQPRVVALQVGQCLTTTAQYRLRAHLPLSPDFFSTRTISRLLVSLIFETKTLYSKNHKAIRNLGDSKIFELIRKKLFNSSFFYKMRNIHTFVGSMTERCGTTKT